MHNFPKLSTFILVCIRQAHKNFNIRPYIENFCEGLIARLAEHMREWVCPSFRICVQFELCKEPTTILAAA